MTGMDDDERHAHDAALLALIVRRDPRGIEELYDCYGPVAFSLAYRLLSDRGLAEDVVREAFLKIWRQARTYDTRKGTVRAWLLTYVHHSAIDEMRRMRAKRAADGDIDDALPLIGMEDTWLSVVATLDQERIVQALATLPAEQRQVVTLAYFAGLSHSEIAARDALPLGTVKGRMRLALHKLCDALQPAPVQ